MSNEFLRVAVALIARGGRYLIRQRPPLPNSPMPGYWEFPGGKCHAGESLIDCVRREILEEVGLPIDVLRLRRTVRHVYPHAHVELYFYDCILSDDRAEPAAETGFRWVAVDDLPNRRFPGGNDPIVRELIGEQG